MEAEIKNAIGLGSPQLTPEPTAQVLEIQKPEVTIYDFGRLMDESEPVRNHKNRRYEQ
ncbi:hypothetical protein I8748_32145 [Nostoc sp. CENA67]|uniref:Uncharacterized protein n=1 Tax=Amazonocrinis nigriterrae CENA67 TaxID=2794033 RepID=A0A8J7LEH7_9NOST|nr:hypothetical protein [Amazonocrinis nigriterrae]MBH8566751.1 hypothetical protein [Amazonocrinis nigriterrae CENA67]